MDYLFSPAGEAAIVTTMQACPLLAFDFDGTLAPLVDRPADARIPAAVAARLQQMAGRLPVAVITGRRVADISERLHFSPVLIVGNHGAEDPVIGIDEAAVASLDPLRQRLQQARDRLRQAGVVTEDKGASIALHYRGAADPAAALTAIGEVTAALGTGLLSYPGKMVLNVVSAQANDKAQALAGLTAREGRQAAVFVGDDLNDEPVFARGEPGWLTVKVGSAGPSSARFFLHGIDEMPAMLDRLLAALPTQA